MQKDTFLIKLVQAQARNSNQSVKLGALESILGINYREIVLLSKYWAEVGAVQSISARGGNAEYMVTPLGRQIVAGLARKRQWLWMAMGSAVLAAMAAVYVYSRLS